MLCRTALPSGHIPFPLCANPAGPARRPGLSRAANAVIFKSCSSGPYPPSTLQRNEAGRTMARILLIDDEALVRETMRMTLSEAGHAVEVAADGAEGLRMVHALRPDLVVTDIVMPAQEGIETIMAIRKAAFRMPIIAISGGNTGKVDFLQAAAALGATRVLRKPFGGAVLLAMVAECLAERPA